MCGNVLGCFTHNHDENPNSVLYMGSKEMYSLLASQVHVVPLDVDPEENRTTANGSQEPQVLKLFT